MQKALVAIILIALAGGAAFFLNQDDNAESNNNQSTNQTTSSADESPLAASDENTEVATITFADDSFSPSTLTIKSGITVTVKNSSSQTIQFDSDPHPAHTGNTELNIDTIRPGQTKSFTASRVGTFGYHDHLNPSATGTIIVE